MTEGQQRDAAFAARHFGRLWPVHVDELVRLLVRLRSEFDGDLDTLLLMAVIGSVTLPRRDLPGDFTYDVLVHGLGLMIRKQAINTQSLADFTGIPRETARRKLDALRSRGWLDRDADGNWTATRRASAELTPATEATLAYLTRIRDTIREIDAEEAGARG